MTDAELAAIQHASHLAFYERAVTRVEAVGGSVRAAVSPHVPDRSLPNAVLYDDPAEVAGRLADRLLLALGNKKFCILRNHGLLTVGRSVEESVGWFVMAERVAEVHVKAPNGRPISDEASAAAASTLALDPVGWRMFQWLRRSLVPDVVVD